MGRYGEKHPSMGVLMGKSSNKMIKWRFIAENIIEVLNCVGWTLQPRVPDD